MADYADLFTEEDEWFGGFDEDAGYYIFKKAVVTDDGARFLQIVLGLVDAEGKLVEEGDEGQIRFYVYDPYYYAWPTDFVDVVLEYFGSEASVPAYADADYYELETSYVSYGAVAIYCYTDDDESVDAYSLALQAAGYAVSNGMDEDGYYSAISATEDLKISFTYDGDLGDLEIWIEAYQPVIDEWPADEVAALVAEVNADTTTVLPALDGGDAYEVTDQYLLYYGCGVIFVDGAATLLDTYEAALLADEWVEAANGYISPDGELLVALSYNADGYLIIYIYNAPITGWPEDIAAAIVESIAPGSQTVLPALDGGIEYAQYGSDEIDVYGESTLLDAYVAVLTGANWTVSGDGYLSPEGDIIVTLSYNSYYGCLEIILAHAPYAAWPTNEIAALLPGVTDVLPAFSPDNNGFSLLNDSYGTAVVVSVAEGREEISVGLYEDVLEQQGYLFDSEKGYYVSPNNQIFVSVYTETAGTITIAFMANPASAEFPLDLLNAFLTEYELGFTFADDMGLVDTAGNGYTFGTGVYYYYAYAYITVDGNVWETWADALDAFLTANGYEAYDQNDTGIAYMNDDEHMVQITYDADTNVTQILFME